MSLYPGPYLINNILPPINIPPIQVPPIQIPPQIQEGITGIQEGITGIQETVTGIPGQIQSAIDGIQGGINTALTPDPHAWEGWNTAWGDLGKRFSELFTDVTYQGQNNAAGIGKLGLPSLVIAGVIGSIGLGMIEYMNGGLAFGLAALILGGLFLMGNAGSSLSETLNTIRQKLGY